MNVVGILVCNNQKVLDHKLRDGKRSDGSYCYWAMTKFPTKILEAVDRSTLTVTKSPNYPIFNEDDQYFPEHVEVRLYFAVSGIVMGYFVCKAIGKSLQKYELRFFSDDWVVIKPIQIKSSQGFRYFNHEEKS